VTGGHKPGGLESSSFRYEENAFVMPPAGAVHGAIMVFAADDNPGRAQRATARQAGLSWVCHGCTDGYSGAARDGATTAGSIV
jgi:hypothetical protein